MNHFFSFGGKRIAVQRNVGASSFQLRVLRATALSARPGYVLQVITSLGAGNVAKPVPVKSICPSGEHIRQTCTKIAFSLTCRHEIQFRLRKYRSLAAVFRNSRRGDAMKDLTPASMRCALSISCPAVYELPDGKLAIVGMRAYPNCGYPQLRGKIGELEAAIIIDRALLANVDPFPSNYKAPDNPYEGIDENYTKPDVINVPQ